MYIQSKHLGVTTGLLMSAALFLGGCNSAGEKQQSGQVMGGVVGGVLGSTLGRGKGRLGATLAGVVVGAYIGGQIGKSMDQKDRARAQGALEHTRSHESVAWTNPDSGNQYRVTPQQSYNHPQTHRPCREYETEAYVGGRRENSRGRACRNESGHWQEEG